MCFQKEGIEKNLGMGKLIDFEVNLLKTAMPELIANIQKGEEFVERTYNKWDTMETST